MRKIYFFIVLTVFSMCTKLYAGAGVYDGWMTIGATTYNFGSSANPLNGANLGVFMVGNSQNISFTEALVWKDGSGNICSAEVFYKISGTGSTAYTGTIKGTGSMSYNSYLGGNDYKWKKDTAFLNQDILSGLLAGSYQIEFWIKSTGSISSNSGCNDDLFLNNGGANFKATFTVNEPAIVTVGSIGGTSFCAGASLNIPYTATGTFGAGNIFTAQLSNASGSFAAPTTIGSLTSTVSGTISTTIPAGTVYGAGYRIRVVSSNPAVDGSDNGTNLTINPVISSAILHYPKTETICDNAPFTAYGRIGIAGITNNDGTSFSGLTAQFGYGTSNSPATWTWSPANYGAQGASVDNTKDEYSFTIPANTLTSGTTYYYGFKFKLGDCTEVLAGQNGIFNNDPGVLTVLQGTKITTQPTASQTVNLYTYTTLSVTASANVSGALSYQWYRNTTNSNIGGTAISGETNTSYVVNTYTSGTFYYYLIASTGGGSCDSTTSNVSTVIVNDATTSGTANWANIQSPKMELDLYLGAGIDIYAQIFIPNSTPGTGTDSDVKAWIGYSSTNTNPNTWAESQWIAAEPNPLQSQLVDNNDEYMKQGFGTDLPLGTYYVASRFQKGTGAYVYGGTEDTTDNVSGGIWGIGPYKSLKININGIITWIPNSGNTTGEWNNGVGPVITSPAIIATDLSSPTTFSAKTLTINNNVGLTIASGQAITLDNELINNNGISTSKTLTVESGGNFIQNNPSTSNVGNIKVKREAVVPKTQYNFWSSPVSGQNLYGLYQSGNAVVANRVYTYNTLTDYYTAVPSGNFASGIGYSIQGESFSNSSAAFFGLPNNGDFSVELRTTGNRYNLIGNPYPSNISAEVFYTSNVDHIENTLWFWDNTGNTAAVQMGSGYSTYGTNNFATYNLPSGVGNPATATQNNASKIPNGKIVVGQGFIVKAKNTISPKATFKNSMRTSDSGVFFAKQSVAKDVFWLQLVTPTNLINTTAVVYNNNAQNNLDEFDSDFPSLSSDAVYTLADNDYKKLSIQGRNSTGLENDRLRIGAQFYKDGTYTFIMKERQGIFESGQKIYLKDKKTNIYTDLTSQSYSFEATKGIDENRFEIVYKNLQVLGIDNNRKSEFVLYKDGDSFVVQSSQAVGKVEVYDVAGRLIREASSREKGLRMIVSDLPNAVYIIKAENSGNPKMKKIIK